MSERGPAGLKALVFDVFGTVVDWRSSVIRDLEGFGRAKGITADWTGLTDDWRAGYQPAMERVRKGEQPWTVLDDLHRATLDTLVEKYRIAGLAEDEKVHLAKAWHRPQPLARRGGGPHAPQAEIHHRHALQRQRRADAQPGEARGPALDMIFGAELVQRYKPDPLTYLGVPKLLRVAPGEVMLVAAHNGDLLAASRQGLKTPSSRAPPSTGRTKSATSRPSTTSTSWRGISCIWRSRWEPETGPQVSKRMIA